MKKITVVTNKVRRHHRVAESWEELTTGIYQRVVCEWDGKDLIRLFSILSGIEYAGIADSNSQELEEDLILCTSYIFQEHPEFKSYPVPKTITIAGKTIPVPQQIGRLSIGQNIHVRQRLAEIQKREGAYDEIISFVVAIYLQPVLEGGVFDFDKAMLLEEEVKKMPITSTYPLGFFLLSPLTLPGLSLLPGLHLIRRLQMRSAAAFQKLLRWNGWRALRTWTS